MHAVFNVVCMLFYILAEIISLILSIKGFKSWTFRPIIDTSNGVNVIEFFSIIYISHLKARTQLSHEGFSHMCIYGIISVVN